MRAQGIANVIETVAIGFGRFSQSPAASGATSTGSGARSVLSQALYKWLFEAGFDYVSASPKEQRPDLFWVQHPFSG